MDFERMNEIQRRLHNAACVLGADGDEYGFEQLQRDAIAEIERLQDTLKRQDKAHHQEVQEQVAAERERCANLCKTTPWPVWGDTTEDLREALAGAMRGA